MGRSRLLIWLVAAAAALLFAWRMEVGPVLLKVNERHGLHLGDVVAGAVCFGYAALATGAVRARREQNDDHDR